jgi:hypothetical protein
MYGLDSYIGYFNTCIDFKLLKVKVPIIFLSITGFLLRREGRYYLLLCLDKSSIKVTLRSMSLNFRAIFSLNRSFVL